MVRNPPAYYIMTGRRGIVIPYNDIATLLEASRKFGARYAILERVGMPALLTDLYEHPEDHPDFTYLGALDDSHIYLIKTSP